ncbi:serine/threonine protein kinase [Corynebacterium caspium]|uniref:serine/threonine protein kinase n=1 Tax=Corynebacterium caspium TaxID=234828 RepID=UPI000364EAEF|nr:serine/threonine protein kinase [Corynebacterium caspium]WKD58661.1 Serine/threonine-protein kinase PknG [Corynebacterium caspium DSM 44850]
MSSDKTEAVAFNPWDEDTGEFPVLGAAEKEINEATGPNTQPGFLGDPADLAADRASTSQRAREEALSTFRSRRSSPRADRLVADGMVSLPFVELITPEEALIDTHPQSQHLQAGEVVAEQYEIMGVIAHGGMGWIYLAHDRNVSDRVVVLKALQTGASAKDFSIAEAEQQFLADITHPEIVKIFNFIDDPRVPGGMIVMEYVGGPPLSRRAKCYPGGLMPLDIAIAYLLEVLPAIEYLHERGVVYNDMKPENIIATEDQVKLIDLGAVTGIGAFGYIYGTPGYQAPEIATQGPAITTDMYAIGRTLASLTIDMPRDEKGVMLPGIPSPNTVPLLRRYVSFYRLLLRLTHPDPAKRFDSIAALRTQLYGVMREVIALRDGRTFPHQHSLFSPQRRTFGTKHVVFRTDQLLDGVHRSVRITPLEVISALPVPLVNPRDPGASVLASFSYSEPDEALETLRNAAKRAEYLDSREIPLGIVRTLLELGATTRAHEYLTEYQHRFPKDWRSHWYSGIRALLLDDLHLAQEEFSAVLSILPGESAPKLALAAVNEMLLYNAGLATTPLLPPGVAPAASDLDAHNDENAPALNKAVPLLSLPEDWVPRTNDPTLLRFHAIRLYALVWLTNPSTVSSAFGLSRQLLAEGSLELAIAALDRVPQASRHHRMAQLTAIMEMVSGELTESRIRRAARRLEEIPTNEPRFHQIKTAVMAAGLTFLRDADARQATSPDALFEFPFSRRGLRAGLADTLRQQARNAPFPEHRYALVDIANQVRPITWF